MIKLHKGAEPGILARNASRWTSTVIDSIDAGRSPTRSERNRYNHADIKQSLLAETHSKCAYCESKLRHVTYGDVEHVVPKSDDPRKWFDWHNLTIACDVCNTNKSKSPVDENSFIDPYDVDPEEHFWQLGSMICARPGCDAAALTERLMDLNRAELVERRSERIKSLMRLLDSVMRCTDPRLRTLLWEELALECRSHNEYAALARSIVELARRKLDIT